MPKRPVAGAKMVSMELPPDLVEEAKDFGRKRGEGFKDVVVAALRRHMAYPPPPPAPEPPPAPLPDVPQVKPAKPKGGKGKAGK